MDNLFSLDRKSEEIINPQVFNFQRSDANLVLGSVDESREIEKERKVPFIVKSYYWVFSIGGFIGVCLAGDGLLQYGKDPNGDNSFFSNGVCIALVIIGALLLIGASIYLIMGLKISKSYKNTDHNKEVDKKQELSEDELKTKMGVPDNTPAIDTLFSIIKNKNNGTSKQVSVLSVKYVNYPSWIWVKSNTCYIVNYFCRVEIPLENITGFTSINERLSLAYWNKNEEPAVYSKEPNTATARGGLVHIKKYYSLDISISDRKYDILIPNYDIELAEGILGIKAND